MLFLAITGVAIASSAQKPAPPTNLHVGQDYPDASNTGVPPGTVLTASGSLTVTTAGAIINARDISGSLTINAPNVTVRRTRIRSTDWVLVRSNSTGFILEDSEIDCMGANRDGMDMNRGAIVRRVNVHGCENGFNVSGSGTLTDSFIHDLVTANGAHTDGAQFNQGASDIVFRHNTFLSVSNSTSCIIMWDGGGAQNARVWIEDNRLIGTGTAFPLYTPRSPGSSDVYINNNRFMPGVYGGYLGGPTTYVTEFKGNVRDDNGNPL